MKVIGWTFQTLGQAFEPLRENQKPRREFENLGQMFEKLGWVFKIQPPVFVITWLLLSQSATVNNSVNYFIKMREIGKFEDHAMIFIQVTVKVK